MKKLLIAAMAASLVMAFTACENDDSSSKEKDEDSKTDAISSVIDDESNPVDESEDESEPEDNSEPEDESKTEDESKPEDESESEDDSSTVETGFANGVYTGNGYTFNVDESLWKDSSDMNSAVDCMFMYVGESDDPMTATANFNVISQSTALYGDNTSAKDYADLVKEQYGSIDGYTVTGDGEVSVNGMNAYKIDLTVEQASMTMDMSQIIIVNDSSLVVFSYGAEESVFESLEDAFNDVITSLTIK